MKKIYLVDISSIFFRAFFAVRELTAPSGLPVNAIYGFLTMLTRLIKEEKPEYMVFCYDRKEPSFRKELYTDYKANRDEMPDDLAKQLPYIRKIGELIGIPALEVPNYEADDIIGTMSAWAVRNQMQAVIVSGDKDFAQLIRPGVIMYDTMKNRKFDEAQVKEKWGVEPRQFIDYLSIVGDASDNIPGVRGIGEKGAVKLLSEFDTLEKIYENVESISSKSIKEKLIASKENAFLSKQLVTIKCDIPVKEAAEEYRLKAIRTNELRDLLKELNFKSLERSLLGDEQQAGGIGQTSFQNFEATGESPTEKQSQFEVTGGSARESQSEIQIHKSANERANKQSTDGATASINKKTDSAVGGSESESELESENSETVALNVRDMVSWLKSQEEVWCFFDDRSLFISNKNKTYALDGDSNEFGDQIRSEIVSLKWNGYDLKTFWTKINLFPKNNITHAELKKSEKLLSANWDSMLAAYLILNQDCESFPKVYAKLMGEPIPEFASPSLQVNYHFKLIEFLKEKMEQMHLTSVLEQIELPLVPILFQMERLGIKLDIEELKKQSKSLAEDIVKLETEIYKISGENFNIASPKQLSVILFEKMGIPPVKKTKTGFSTDNEVLEKIEHPIAPKLIQYRELTKLKSTYVDALPLLVNEKDHRIHTTFNQAMAATGRLSSINPNIQNIPIRTERGQLVRNAFIADEGKVLLSVDYSQIELRILAHYSDDVNLVKAFKGDIDVHTVTASEVFGVSAKDVTSDLRRKAKAVNFGIAYGQGAFGLAETLNISRSESQEIIKNYFSKFPGVKNYIEETVKSAHEKGYVETIYGRRRYIEQLKASSVQVKKFGERAAINAPIQGSASDIVKLAMIKLAKEVDVPMLLQVHDELIFEASAAEIEKFKSKICEIMENIVQLNVPLKVNASIGKNWGEAH